MSDEHTKCRRCSECEGQEHHWIDELIMDPRLSPTADPVGDNVCKHCPAVGSTCGECDGCGTVEVANAAGQETEVDCPVCGGLGVAVVEGVTVVEDEDGTPVVRSKRNQ